MKKILILLTFLPGFLYGQSKVMRHLSEEFPEARALVFYYSSLNMLNIDDNPQFSEMIRDIEKIKVLIVEKDSANNGQKIIAGIKADLNTYGFAELMTMKNKDYDIGVYILDDDDIEGFFFIMDEEERLIAVDLVGSMPVSDVGLLIEKIKEANDF